MRALTSARCRTAGTLGPVAMVLVVSTAFTAAPCRATDADLSLHDTIVRGLVAELDSPDTAATAAENLGMLRAYDAAGKLAAALASAPADTRRAAALSLAWCGGRQHVPALLAALDDTDWSVRQAAWVALTNLTGMEFPFEAHADPGHRERQAGRWHTWWASVAQPDVPPEILDLLGTPPPGNLAANREVTVSSTYKGPAAVLTDRSQDGFWQTKNVPFPQHCTVDLGSLQTVEAVTVDQYGPGFCMTDYAIEASRDGTTFMELRRDQGLTPPRLVIPVPTTEARYVRIVSYAAENRIYPTTFYRVGVFAEAPDPAASGPAAFLRRERALRALGSLGGKGAAAHAVRVLRPYTGHTAGSQAEKWMVQAGIRALGRLPDAEAQVLLIELLDHTDWARYAADALGDWGGTASAEALITAYPTYAMTPDRHAPERSPTDDRPGFEAVDRMYETPHAIALALSRFPLKQTDVRQKLHGIAPLLVANMASDFDGAMIYEEQSYQKVTAYLLERAGVRRAVCEIAFQAVGAPSPGTAGLPDPVRAALLTLARSDPGGTSIGASWLTALCRDRESVPRLIALLAHKNGWVRINAVKTLMYMGERSAATEIAELLEASRTEAEHGTCTEFLFQHTGKQGQGEFNAPSPRWREAFTRALGQVGSGDQVPLLVRLLNDERNALEVRYAAAISLDKIGTTQAVSALRHAASAHAFHSIRLLAREALWKRGLTWDAPPTPRTPITSAHAGETQTTPEALVFIKGRNDMPNDFQIDIWRQAYSTTDSGPTYRLGRNLFLLAPADSNGVARPLTTFTDGYVADCEVSWDGTRVIFARRDGDHPWWHIYELELASSALTQLTRGPYHDVQPAYLPDGRIIFSSSRIGMRDEYHGYPATGLTVMNGDGTDIHCVGFNLGRDNEPALLPDGRVIFGRLELFYSRLKTEITLQTVRPDGTMNQTIYGPERRDFWHRIQMASGDGGWGEAPPRHRVLRLTQPQPYDDERVIVATTGGATLVGPGRLKEHIIPRWNNMTVTSPYSLGYHQVLCASTVRTSDRSAVDLGLYTMDARTGQLTLLYNDPDTADFEARPVMRRSPPHILPDSVTKNTFTARLLCNSARTSQDASTRDRGKLVRIVEGQPVTGRHHTHTSSAGEAWKNHTGTHARILGTVPLAADGSFFVEVPADRLLHCQVLDSDRRVVGNQLIWMYARPGETRSCVGCHERPDSAAITHQPTVPVSARYPPLECLPSDQAFSYRAKAWQKGTLRPETEERTRTVNAINFPGRH